MSNTEGGPSDQPPPLLAEASEPSATTPVATAAEPTATQASSAVIQSTLTDVSTTPANGSSTQNEPAGDHPPPSSAPRPLAYCYACARTVPVNRSDVTCSLCNGGFIEMAAAR